MWRQVYHDGDPVPWAEIQAGKDWIWPDCSYKCAHCGRCLGCIRNLVFDDNGNLTEDAVCPVSPNRGHKLTLDEAVN